MTPILAARNVSMQFSGVRVLQDINLELFPGEVLAVVGENGAGKSTLMRVLSGVHQPTSGSLEWQGSAVRFANVDQAQRRGVALIHQELNLAPNLSVAANIWLGREPHARGFLKEQAIFQGARHFLEQVGLSVSPDLRVDRLTIGQQQLVEIAKALSTHAQVLIMDEPTSALSSEEAARLGDVITELKSRGVAIVYISHRLQEVTDWADRVVVLRDGALVGELRDESLQRDAMVRLMVGRDLDGFYVREPHVAGEEALHAIELRSPAFPAHPISFRLAAGEIVALAGLVGAGRTELLSTLFGVTPAIGGNLRIGGRPVDSTSPAQAIRAGLALVPEDRRRQGLLLQKSVPINLALASLRERLARWGFVRGSESRKLSEETIHTLRIKLAARHAAVRYLSGGNQQKVVIGKWLATGPQVLLLDEPTRGIDVGSKTEIYGLLHRLAGEGLAILFASSEMEEILGLADRVLVMHQGRLVGELTRDAMTEEAIMTLAVGGA